MKFLKPAVFAALLACAACSAQDAAKTDAPAAAAPVQSAAKEEANKATVQAFYDAAINQKDYEKAASYLGAGYKQHNPTAQDGPEGLKAFIDFLKARFPDQHNEIKHVYADGDFVILHVQSTRSGAPDRALVDIFRLDEAGKVVEHWDVIQDIPAEPANTNTMF